jgi:hypothetical protein
MFQNRTSRPKPYYLCANDQCTAHAAVSNSIIEPVVEKVFLEHFGGWRVPERRSERVAPVVDPEELALVGEALEDVEVALAAPDLDDEEGLRLLRVRRELRVRLAELQDRSAAPATPRLVPFREGEETYAERWAKADISGRAKLLASVWSAIEVAPGVRGKREQPEERFRFLEWDELVERWG